MTTITLNGQKLYLDLTAMTPSARETLLTGIAKLQNERDEYKQAYEVGVDQALRRAPEYERAKRAEVELQKECTRMGKELDALQKEISDTRAALKLERIRIDKLLTSKPERVRSI